MIKFPYDKCESKQVEKQLYSYPLDELIGVIMNVLVEKIEDIKQEQVDTNYADPGLAGLIDLSRNTYVKLAHVMDDYDHDFAVKAETALVEEIKNEPINQHLQSWVGKKVVHYKNGREMKVVAVSSRQHDVLIVECKDGCVDVYNYSDLVE